MQFICSNDYHFSQFDYKKIKVKIKKCFWIESSCMEDWSSKNRTFPFQNGTNHHVHVRFPFQNGTNHHVHVRRVPWLSIMGTLSLRLYPVKDRHLKKPYVNRVPWKRRKPPPQIQFYQTPCSSPWKVRDQFWKPGLWPISGSLDGSYPDEPRSKKKD